MHYAPANHVGKERARTSPSLLAAGIGASSCCVLPFALFTFGIRGASIGNLTALAPYQPIFVALALTCLGAGFWRVYRRPKEPCAEGIYCARPASMSATSAGGSGSTSSCRASRVRRLRCGRRCRR